MKSGIRTWWLFAACALETAIAVLYFKGVHGFHSRHTVVLFGRLALAAGACAIAAGVRTAPRDWLLAANGLAFGILGLVLNGVFGFRIGFRLIAFLILASAATMAAVEWQTGQLLRTSGRNSRAVVFLAAALLLLLFAVIFAILTVTGLRVAPGSNPEFLLFGVYFSVSALSVLALVWGKREVTSRA